MLAAGLALGALGAGAMWFTLPGDGLSGKIDALVASMQPVEFAVVDVVLQEGGGSELVLEARPVDSWDVTSLQVSELRWSWTEVGVVDADADDERIPVDVHAIPGELQTRPPLLTGRDPARLVVRFPRAPADGTTASSLRFRVEVSAFKRGGAQKVNIGYDEVVLLSPRGDGEPADDEPR